MYALDGDAVLVGWAGGATRASCARRRASRTAVGAIAVTLAAQKGLENRFGGVTIAADQPVRVGGTQQVVLEAQGRDTEVFQAGRVEGEAVEFPPASGTRRGATCRSPLPVGTAI